MGKKKKKGKGGTRYKQNKRESIFFSRNSNRILTQKNRSLAQKTSTYESRHIKLEFTHYLNIVLEIDDNKI